MRRRIVTSGVDSEYVLSELCRHLRQCGHDVTELDFGSFSGDARSLLRSFDMGEAAYITSAHINFSVRLASSLVPKFAERYPNYLAPVDIIPLLRPGLSIYIPHDLLTPYGDANLNEYRFLDCFDHVMAPVQAEVVGAIVPPTTQVHAAGWIKYCRSEYPSIGEPRRRESPSPNIMLFVSMFEHLLSRFGVEGLVDYFRPILVPGARIKLPAWNGARDVEQALAAVAGIEVVPTDVGTAGLILDADIVVCNGASSIHAEASMLGRPTICLLDDEGISRAEQRHKLATLPNVAFHDYRRREPIPRSLIAHVLGAITPAVLKPFDFALVEKIVAGHKG